MQAFISSLVSFVIIPLSVVNSLFGIDYTMDMWPRGQQNDGISFRFLLFYVVLINYLPLYVLIPLNTVPHTWKGIFSPISDER